MVKDGFRSHGELVLFRTVQMSITDRDLTATGHSFYHKIREFDNWIEIVIGTPLVSVL